MLKKSNISKYFKEIYGLEDGIKPNELVFKKSCGKYKYNECLIIGDSINSDILVREFILNARGKQYKAFLLYIDGMVDSKILNDFVLEPLMLRNRNNLFDGDQNFMSE